MQNGRRGRLHPAVGRARTLLEQNINHFLGQTLIHASGKARPQENPPLFLVGCSGGPDSLALASLAAHFVRRGEIRIGAIIVDHQLQTGSDEVAAQAAQTCRDMGLSPVLVRSVTVDADHEGPEMAARIARYAAFEDAVKETGAQGIMLAHTLDDQAETVLLGLARGSGTKSLGGMSPVRVHHGVNYLRPLLNLRRYEVEQICVAEGLDPWYDPTNLDQSLMRAKVRHSILPFLEEHLGGSVALSLARTAAISGPDAQYLEEEAERVFARVQLELSAVGGVESLNLPAGTPSQNVMVINRYALSQEHPALQHRVLSLAVRSLGGENPSFERLQALGELLCGHTIAGPIQLAGKVSAYRRRPPAKVTVELRSSAEKKEILLKETGVIVLLTTV
ncbi:tRNA lysidine(34) synthetase TilS [Rothia sp. P13129]|uniref:tRNA lysidine(34) synthetase TilS n=1 Tax=Rothia sp. P13129 TaxID=3402664 RepID=UPI003AD7C116